MAVVPMNKRLVVLATTVVITACFIDRLTAPGVGTASVSLAVDSVVAIGGTIPARATVAGATTGGPSRVLWSSSDPTVATVDSAGVVHGVAKGAVTITGKVTAPELDSAVSRSSPVRVAYASIAVDSIDSLTGLGQTHPAQVRGRNAQGVAIAVLTGAAVLWRMAPDTSVLAVDGSGVLTARANGTAFIVASFEGLRDSVAVKVRQVARSVSFIGGASFTFTSLNHDTSTGVVVTDVAGAPIASPTVVWSSMNTQHATVSASGTMRALSRVPDTVTAQVDTAKGLLVTHVNQVAKTLVSVGGGAQIDTVGRLAPVPPSVQVRDAGAAGVPGVAVTFTVVGNGGKLTAGSVSSDTGGVAATGWTMGDTAKVDSLRVTAGGLDTVAFTATAVASHAKTIGATSLQAQSAVVNTTVAAAPAVAVQDTFGNAVLGATVIFVVDSGAGKLTGATPSTGTSGIAAVTSWQVGTTAGTNNNRVSASTAALPGSVIVFRATGTPGAPSGATSIIVLSKDTIIAGQSAAITVHSKDAFGNPETTGGAVVAFSFNGGVSRGTFSVVTDGGNGTYTAGVKGTTAGTATSVTGTIDGSSITTLSPSLLVIHGVVAQLALNIGDNQTATAGTAVALPPAVIVEDSFTNAISGDTVLWTITADSGLLIGDTSVSGVNGGASPATWVLGHNGGANAMMAAVGGVTRTFHATGTLPSIGTTTPLGNLLLGLGPTGVGADTTRDLYYVADSGSNVVTVIDGSSMLATDSIPVGSGPVAIAVNDVANRIYVVNAVDSSVSVIDGGSKTVVATIPMPFGGTNGVAVNPATDSVYVTTAEGQVLVIDGATNLVTGPNVMPVESAEYVAVDPLANRIYAAGQNSGAVFVFDGSNRSLIAQPVVANPTGLVVDPQGHRFFVTDERNGVLRAFSTDGDTAVGSTSIGSLPSRLAVDPGTGKLYVSSCAGGVSIVDEATLSAIGTAAGRLFTGCGNPDSPLRFAVDGRAHRLVVANPIANMITVDDGGSGSELGLVLRVGSVTGLTIDGGRGRLYAAVSQLPQVVVVDWNTHQILDAVRAGTAIGDLTVNPASDKLYVSDASTTVTPFDAATLTPGAGITLPETIQQMAVNPVTDRIYARGSLHAYAIDGASGAVVGPPIGTGAVVVGIAVDTIRNLIYLGGDAAPHVIVFDGNTNGFLANTTASGAQGVGAAVNATLNRAYSADLDSPGKVMEFDGAADTLFRVLMVGTDPLAVYADGRKNLLYVPNNASDLWVLSSYLGQEITILSPGAVRHLVTDGATGTVFAVVGTAIVTIQP